MLQEFYGMVDSGLSELLTSIAQSKPDERKRILEVYALIRYGTLIEMMVGDKDSFAGAAIAALAKALIESFSVVRDPLTGNLIPVAFFDTDRPAGKWDHASTRSIIQSLVRLYGGNMDEILTLVEQQNSFLSVTKYKICSPESAGAVRIVTTDTNQTFYIDVNDSRPFVERSVKRTLSEDGLFIDVTSNGNLDVYLVLKGIHTQAIEILGNYVLAFEKGIVRDRKKPGIRDRVIGIDTETAKAFLALVYGDSIIKNIPTDLLAEMFKELIALHAEGDGHPLLKSLPAAKRRQILGVIEERLFLTAG